MFCKLLTRDWSEMFLSIFTQNVSNMLQATYLNIFKIHTVWNENEFSEFWLVVISISDNETCFRFNSEVDTYFEFESVSEISPLSGCWAIGIAVVPLMTFNVSNRWRSALIISFCVISSDSISRLSISSKLQYDLSVHSVSSSRRCVLPSMCWIRRSILTVFVPDFFRFKVSRNSVSTPDLWRLRSSRRRCWSGDRSDLVREQKEWFRKRDCCGDKQSDFRRTESVRRDIMMERDWTDWIDRNRWIRRWSGKIQIEISGKFVSAV